MKTFKNFVFSGKKRILVFLSLIAACLTLMAVSCEQPEKVGVIFVTHGGFDIFQEQYVWDVGMQQMSYDHNHAAYQAINNSRMWPSVLQQEIVKKYNIKYEVFYNRIGGIDPFPSITDSLTEKLQNVLEIAGRENNISFIVDQANWMCGDDIGKYPYPRQMYYPPNDTGDNCTYCGEKEPDGPWPGCDPERYNVDGPAERLLKQGVSRIIMIDQTTGGVRFGKTYDVYTTTKKVVDEWNDNNGDSVSVLWINDYTDLMQRSFPTDPPDWTRNYRPPEPIVDPTPPWSADQNPVTNDPELAALHVNGIISQLSDTVSPADTAVMILNHAIHDHNEYFDPKIDDTIVINKNIKAELLEMFPDMNPDNIIGAYMGIKEVNPENGLYERTREMRGEDLGHAWLYESDKELPGEPWGYKYWEALEILKNQGAKHIVICFPQIVSHSVLDMVEVPNQVAKEIGHKNWLYHETGDSEKYPDVGHPFMEYMGNWVDTECDGEPCCFTMGGCADGRPYPPPRQTPLDIARGDFDPSLAYHVSEYGHLGYDPEMGLPDTNSAVQDQYTGTWAMWDPPNYEDEFAEFLAKHVIDAALDKLQ